MIDQVIEPDTDTVTVARYGICTAKGTLQMKGVVFSGSVPPDDMPNTVLIVRSDTYGSETQAKYIHESDLQQMAVKMRIEAISDLYNDPYGRVRILEAEIVVLEKAIHNLLCIYEQPSFFAWMRDWLWSWKKK